MLWGIHLTNPCIVDCTAVGSDISSVQMYVRQLIFQSINNSLLCFSCPPWTWRAAPGTTGFSWVGVFSRGCLRNSRQAVVSTCVLFFSAMVGTFLVVVLMGNCWRRTQCFTTTIIFFTTTVTLRITSKGVLTSSNSPRSSIFLELIYSCCGINLVELTRHHCVTKM